MVCMSGICRAQKSASATATLENNIVVKSEDDHIDPAMLPSNQPQAPVSFRKVDQMPAFPGDLRAFIGEHLIYPDSALKAGIGGRVIIQFVVRKDGHLSDIVVVQRAAPILNNAAIKLMSIMPTWIPGKNSGENVDVPYVLPIDFNPK